MVAADQLVCVDDLGSSFWDPVFYCVFIFSIKLLNSRDMNSPGMVGASVASVSYDGIGFAKFPEVSESTA